MVRAGRGEDLVEGQDEEFLFHLNRGSELLSRGDAEGARTSLERALELRPRDAKVLGLLGQAHYRLAKYDDAIVAWQRLVDENPAEPAARVNLGLAFLRAKRQPQATRQLEIALDLNPDHKKAMGYLGLALLESGDPVRAREWFVRAGSDQMVARCDQVLAGAPAGELTPAPGSGGPPDVEAMPVDVEVDDVGLAPLPAPAPLRGMVPAPSPQPAVAGPVPGGAAPEVASFAAARTVGLPEGATFGVSGAVLAVRVHPGVRVRLSGLLAVRGAVEAEPEVKRFRGRQTEKPFGEAAARLHGVHGEGVLLFAAGERRRFTPLQLSEAAFFREESVFGIEEALAFENGRVPSPGAGELNLVHLRGQGTVLVVTTGEPQALQVSPRAPIRLPVAALVGWIGSLTPRLVGLLDGGPSDVLGVELTGEGRVLVDPAAVEPDGGER